MTAFSKAMKHFLGRTRVKCLSVKNVTRLAYGKKVHAKHICSRAGQIQESKTRGGLFLSALALKKYF